MIWTGSNDGLFYVTRDDGKTWTNVTPKDLPPGGRVQNIEPSAASRRRPRTSRSTATCSATFAPYIYRTDDYGKTWTRLTDGRTASPPTSRRAWCAKIPMRAGLLYAGTEFGMYISFDNGAHWHPFQLNLPATPVTDIKVAHKDLVLSTQGRAFWILDNLTPLHQLSEKVASSQATLFKPQEAVRTRSGRGGGGGVGRGGGIQYPAAGAQIDYYVSPELKDDVTIEILDAAGKTIKSSSRVRRSPRRRGRWRRMPAAVTRKAAAAEVGRGGRGGSGAPR